MAKKKSTRGSTPRQSRKNTKLDRKIEFLRTYIRTKGTQFLDDPNITSVGTGYKISQGQESKTLALQFTVGTKAAPETLESLNTQPIPTAIEFGDETIPTDVIERSFSPEFEIVNAEEVNNRKLRIDPVLPGCSVSHISGSAGTFGMTVYDRSTGQPLILSNWHVLDGGGQIGDTVVQPGPFDDNNVLQNSVGRLLRSHLGAAGDCAVASIEDREFGSQLIELEVTPKKIARVELDDILIKSGRTTGVTLGKVRRVDVMASIDYGGETGAVNIGGFEIGPVDGADPTEEISLGGDSGSGWVVANNDGSASEILAGLHFAGETSTNPDEHAIACYAHSVFKKLDITLEPQVVDQAITLEDRIFRKGFDTEFLSEGVPFPKLTTAQKSDTEKLENSVNIPYTHFSVNLSKSRGLARYVAWNINGGWIQRVSRSGIPFIVDPRISENSQNDNSLYRNNPLDRGHIARRADLTWGPLEEARRANRDSFFFTNIAPQHESFNQSSRGGLWGRLENALFEDVDTEDLRVSVMGGPIFSPDDPEHRDVKIPREFWKLLAYRDMDDGEFKVRAYVLTQSSLLRNLETLELDPFRLFQVSINSLEEDTLLDFGNLSGFDTFRSDSEIESRRVEAAPERGRQISSRDDLFV